MPNNPLTPKEEGKNEKSEYKKPDFIIVDDRPIGGENPSYASDSSPNNGEQNHTKETSSPFKSPFSLRFLCLLGLLFCIIFGIGMLLFALALTVLATLTLFLKPKFNRAMWTFWKFYKNAVIAGLGFAVGLISPSIGLGFLLVYFSLGSEEIDSQLMRKIFQRSFNGF